MGNGFLLATCVAAAIRRRLSVMDNQMAKHPTHWQSQWHPREQRHSISTLPRRRTAGLSLGQFNLHPFFSLPLGENLQSLLCAPHPSLWHASWNECDGYRFAIVRHIRQRRTVASIIAFSFVCCSAVSSNACTTCGAAKGSGPGRLNTARGTTTLCETSGAATAACGEPSRLSVGEIARRPQSQIARNTDRSGDVAPMTTRIGSRAIASTSSVPIVRFAPGDRWIFRHGLPRHDFSLPSPLPGADSSRRRYSESRKHACLPLRRYFVRPYFGHIGHADLEAAFRTAQLADSLMRTSGSGGGTRTVKSRETSRPAARATLPRRSSASPFAATAARRSGVICRCRLPGFLASPTHCVFVRSSYAPTTLLSLSKLAIDSHERRIESNVRCGRRI